MKSGKAVIVGGVLVFLSGVMLGCDDDDDDEDDDEDEDSSATTVATTCATADLNFAHGTSSCTGATVTPTTECTLSCANGGPPSSTTVTCDAGESGAAPAWSVTTAITGCTAPAGAAATQCTVADINIAHGTAGCTGDPAMVDPDTTCTPACTVTAAGSAPTADGNAVTSITCSGDPPVWSVTTAITGCTAPATQCSQDDLTVTNGAHGCASAMIDSAGTCTPTCNVAGNNPTITGGASATAFTCTAGQGTVAWDVNEATGCPAGCALTGVQVTDGALTGGDCAGGVTHVAAGASCTVTCTTGANTDTLTCDAGDPPTWSAATAACA